MTDHSISTELLRCPFCGAKPHRGLTKAYPDQLHGELLQHYRIWCPHDCASKRAINEDMAITAWNTRALTTASDADERAKELATLEPVAWQACDERYAVINGIVTVQKSTVDAWRESGIKFKPLYAAPDWKQDQAETSRLAGK